MRKKIIVTGGAGFIGSHLVDELVLDPENEIVILDNMYRGRPENLRQHRDNPQVTLIEGDIRDATRLNALFAGAETIYHLAAQSNVLGAVKDVAYSFETNVVGTFNVLQAAAAAGVRRVVFTSSREVYGEAAYLPVDEDHPLNGKNTYGASKISGEVYGRVFHNNFGLETAILRLANVYGPRDFGRVIPLWLDLAWRAEPLVVYGGEQLIDFIWVGTVVQALLRAAEADIVGTPINIGSGQATSIGELAQRILRETNSPAPVITEPARAAEVVRFQAEISRMRDLLGLTPPADPLSHLGQIAPQLSLG